jgi:hypothetical protein
MTFIWIQNTINYMKGQQITMAVRFKLHQEEVLCFFYNVRPASKILNYAGKSHFKT